MFSERSVHSEISAFNDVWHGGYFEGNPLDPVSKSSYKRTGYLSVLHATFLGCIKPYIKADSLVLEFGPGRGAWTRCMLSAKEVWCLDAKSMEDNKTDLYLGQPKNLIYHKVNDFSCSVLPDDYFTYVFSFGTFCHISFDGLSQYAQNMFPKLRKGAHCFWMLSDYDQFNQVSNKFEHYDILSRTLPPFFLRLLELYNRLCSYNVIGRPFLPLLDKQEPEGVRPGRWYNNDLERVVRLLDNIGYDVIENDMGFVPRDPIVHFMKS
jgi:hypothetical protein